MTRLGAVLFPGYRAFEVSRARTNDSLLAIHVANQVALEVMRAEPDRISLAPAIFSATRDIGRMNLTIPQLEQVIEKSERDFAYMAIPFILSSYQELVKTLRDLWLDGREDDKDFDKLSEVHNNLRLLTGVELPPDLVNVFDLARRIRNRVVHFGGLPGSNLPSELRNIFSDAHAIWRDWSGASIALNKNPEQMDLTLGDVLAVLALTTKLSRLACAELGRRMSRERWIAIAIEDFDTQSPRALRDVHHRARSLRGFTKCYYHAINFSSAEINDGLAVWDSR